MISAREFCREPGYPVSIFLTYSFDPLFFERVPLDDLRVGGTRRILVVADAGEAAEAMKRCIGQIFYLGRKYVLAETRAANTFHPKMIVRLSPTGGRVWIGSGNLTFTGWGGNQEVATAWSLGPNTEDGGAWLNDVLAGVSSMTNSAAFLTQMDTVRSSIKWLETSSTALSAPPVLFGTPKDPLAPQLAERWTGRTFSDLQIFTGSTDVEGAFLLWAHKTFGLKRVIICLSPAYASFDAVTLSKLPFEIHFVKAAPKRLMHAKFYWFSGPDGNAAVMGSANCSAAAWLANHAAGNVEMVVPYDRPEEDDFTPLLDLFNGEQLSPAQILNASVGATIVENDDGDETLHYRIVSLRLRSSGREIEATLEPVPSSDNTVELIIGKATEGFRVSMMARGGGFIGRPDRPIGLGTVFATMEIHSGSIRTVTLPRWIDNEPAIESAAREREVDPDLETLAGRGFGNSSQQKIMAAIYSVSADLLNLNNPDLSRFSIETSGAKSGSKQDDKGDGPVRMVDPAAVLFNLKELAAEKSGKNNSQFGFHGVSLQGVMGMLFSVEKEPDVDLSQETWDGEATDLDEEDGPEKTSKNSKNSGPPPDPATSAQTLAEFRKQIDHFLFELGKQAFADACPAGKMLQAVAFPIMLCTKGNDAGWLPEGMLAFVACRVVHTILRKPYGPGKPRGLLRQVQARYETSGKLDEFVQIVGEGALWAALLASLARLEGSSLSNLIRQADAITSVMACPELIANSNPDQLSLFIRTLIIRDAEFAVTERASRLAEGMKELTDLLALHWDQIYDAQGGGRSLHRGGSIMWCRKWGWEILPTSAAQSYYSDHIDLEAAARANSDIQLAIDILWKAMQMKAAPAERKISSA